MYIVVLTREGQYKFMQNRSHDGVYLMQLKARIQRLICLFIERHLLMIYIINLFDGLL